MSDMDLRAEARKLGELVAWTRNKEMDTDCVGTTETTRIHDALDRLEAIVDILGPTAWDAYAEGFDATIDFSLNSAWRETPEEFPPAPDVPF